MGYGVSSLLGPRKQSFWSQINCSQMKLLFFLKLCPIFIVPTLCKFSKYVQRNAFATFIFSRGSVISKEFFSTQWYKVLCWSKFMFSKKATKIDKTFTVNLTVQAFLDFSGFNFRNFWFTAVYNYILFSSPLVLLSNLDLCGYCFRSFFLESPH